MRYTIQIPKEKSFRDDVKVKTNPIWGNPMEWFDNNTLQNFNLNKIQFDFFIDWSTNEMKNTIWLKRIYDVEPLTEDIQHTFEVGTLYQKILEADYGHFNTNEYLNFFHSKGLLSKYMIIKDRDTIKDFRPYNNEITKSIVTELAINYSSPHTITHINLQNLRQRIRQLTGIPLKTVRKPLNISTSALESYLYESGYDKWPGDCDLLLFDSNYNCVGIIEFKKHNLSERPLENQSVGSYIHSNDKSKYQRLGLLRDYFAKKQNSPVPLIVLIYPSYPTETKIKLEFLEGTWDDLSISQSKVLNGPSNYTNKCNIIREIIGEQLKC